jgi:hypothetical protein
MRYAPSASSWPSAGGTTSWWPTNAREVVGDEPPDWRRAITAGDHVAGVVTADGRGCFITKPAGDEIAGSGLIGVAWNLDE